MTPPPDAAEPPEPPHEPPAQAPPPAEPPVPTPPVPATPAVPAVAAAAAPAVPAPTTGAAERVRAAYQRRNETDYIFNFWTALGWTILTLGIFGFFIIYQLARRSRDHGRRRLEELDAANVFAWEQTEASGRQEELRPNFERVATHLDTLRGMSGDFRDPVVWTVLTVVAAGIVQIVLFILLDGDLVKRDHAEGGAEFELAQIYTALGAPLATPDAANLHTKHNYVGRIVATVMTCGIYGFWWEYNIMTETNHHFEQDWVWEDSLAQAVQSLAPAAA